ncbi:hypothetical protein CBL_04393 [Carabus blaptoides fortunei]
MFARIILFCSLSYVLASTSLDSVENETTTALNSGSSCLNQTIELLLNDDDIKRLRSIIQAKKHSDKKTKAHLCIHAQSSDCPHKQNLEYPIEPEEIELTTKAIEMTIAQLASNMNTLMGHKESHADQLNSATFPETEKLRKVLKDESAPK